MHWDRFDICEAYYCYAYGWHQGQGSRAYEIFGRLQRMSFRPGVGCHDPRRLERNAQLILGKLIRERY